MKSLPLYILADSGSARNLISKAMFKRLTFKPKLRSTRDVCMIRFNKNHLIIDGFALLQASIGTVVLKHAFCVCLMLLNDYIINGKVLWSHQCSLLYESGD